MTDEAHNYHVTVSFLAPEDQAPKLYATLDRGALLPALGNSGVHGDGSASSDLHAKLTWPGRAMNSAAVIKEAANIVQRILKDDVPASLTVSAEALGAGYPFDYDAMVLG